MAEGGRPGAAMDVDVPVLEEPRGQHIFVVEYTWVRETGRNIHCLSPYTQQMSGEEFVKWSFVMENADRRNELYKKWKLWNIVVSEDEEGLYQVGLPKISLHSGGKIEDEVYSYIDSIVKDIFDHGKDILVTKLERPNIERLVFEVNGSPVGKQGLAYAKILLNGLGEKFGYVACISDKQREVESAIGQILQELAFVDHRMEYPTDMVEIFVKTGLEEELQQVVPGVGMSMQHKDSETMLMVLKGTSKDVKKGVQLVENFRMNLDEKKTRFKYTVKQDMVFDNEQFRDNVDRVLYKENVRCAWLYSREYKYIVVFPHKSVTAEKAKECFLHHVIEMEFGLGSREQALIQCSKWSQMRKELINRFKDRVMIEHEKETLYVTGIREAVEEVCKRLKEREEVTKYVKISNPDTYRYMRKQEFENLTRAAASLDAKLIYDDDNDKFIVSGEKEAVNRIEELLSKAAQKIDSEEVDCKAGDFLQTEEGCRLIEGFEKQYNVLIEKQAASKTVMSVKQHRVAGRRERSKTSPCGSGRTRSSTCWRLGRKQKICVVRGPPEDSGAQVVVKFEEGKQRVLEQTQSIRITEAFLQIPTWAQGWKAEQKLQKNVRELVLHCVKQGFTSMAFPIQRIGGWYLSTFSDRLIKALAEIFKEEAAQSQGEPLNSLTVFLCYSYDGGKKLVEGCCSQLLQKWEEDVMTSDPNSGSEICGSRVCMSVIPGLLHETQADVLVNTTAPDLDLSNGAVSKSILNAAGYEIQRECRKTCRNRNLNHGEIVVTGGYKLKCKCVFHAALSAYTTGNEEQFYRQSIQQFVELCLQTADKNRYQSVAFPAVGTGKLFYPLDIVAKTMVSTVIGYSQSRETTLKNVLFVIYPEDELAIKQFQDAVSEAVDKVKETASCRLKIVGQKTDVKKAVDELMISLHVKEQEVHCSSEHTHQSPCIDQSPTKAVTASQSTQRQTMSDNNKFTFELLQFFHEDVLVKYKINFSDGQLKINCAKSQYAKAQKELDQCIEYTNELMSDTFDIPKSVSSEQVKDMVAADKASETNVFVVVDTELQKVTLFGEKWENIQRMKHGCMVKLKIIKPTGMSRKTRNLTGAENLASNQVEENQKTKPPYHHLSSKGKATSNVETFTTKENLKVHVCKANILNLQVDCIVNAANREMRHGGGIARVIADAAGQQLVEDSTAIVKSKGKLSVGKACVTSAGKLPFKWVIHSVGPCWWDYVPKTESNIQRCEDDLFNAVYNSLQEAVQIKMTSVAIPAISAGIFGVPVEICTVQYVKAVVEFSRDMPTSCLKTVHFVDIQPGIVKHIKTAFRSMINDGTYPDTYRKEVYYQQTASSSRDDEDSSDQTQFPFISEDETKHMMVCQMSENHWMKVYTGDIVQMKGYDCIACSENLKGTGMGIIASKLLQALGEAYSKEKTKAFQRDTNWGDVIVTAGKKAHIKNVLHALLAPKGQKETPDQRRMKFLNLYKKIFVATSHESGDSTLLLPLIGSGAGNADPRYCAELMFQSFTEFCKENPMNPLFVHLVSYEKEKTNLVQQVVRVAIEESRKESKAASKKIKKKTVINKIASFYEPKKNASKAGLSQDLKMLSLSEKQMRNSQAHNSQQKNGARSKQHELLDSNGNNDDFSNREVSASQCSCKLNGENSTNTEIQKQKSVATENCVICMDSVTEPKALKCGHIFCTDCIDAYFQNYKKICPTCGVVCGLVTGDQPEGSMDVRYTKMNLAGFEGHGCIEITYRFPDGQQGKDHPDPGRQYRGITRIAYLPDTKEGKLVYEMLQIAFDRKLVFTIGHSRTTGQDGVITWNDIHHKTNPNPGQQFGYPDTTYFERVKEELAVKGVTEADIPGFSDTKKPKRKQPSRNTPV